MEETLLEGEEMGNNRRFLWIQDCINHFGVIIFFSLISLLGGADHDRPIQLYTICGYTGMAYTPYGAIDCTATQANITKDIMQLSQLTTRLRLYAADWYVWARCHYDW